VAHRREPLGKRAAEAGRGAGDERTLSRLLHGASVADARRAPVV
jgi:hypothetical protein